MKILILFVIFNLTLVTNSFAQNQNKIDSLIQLITKANNDTNQVKLHIELAGNYHNANIDTALLEYKKALDLSIKINNQKYIGKSYHLIGVIFYYKSNYEKTLQYWNKSLEIHKKIEDKKRIAANLGNIGLVYQNLRSNKALKFYKRALKINTELGDKYAMIDNIGNIGTLYEEQCNYEIALVYYNKALIISKEINNKYGIAMNLANIGVIFYNQSNYKKANDYFFKAKRVFEESDNKRGVSTTLGNIGNIYSDQSNFEKAIKYYEKALEIKRKSNDKYGIAMNLGNIGTVFNDKGDSKKAKEYFQKALEINTEIGDQYGITINYGNIGIAYKNEGNFDKAKEYYKKSLKIYIEIGDKSGVSNSYINLGNLYFETKQYKKAIEYANKSLVITKKIEDTKNEKAGYSLLSTTYWALYQNENAAKYFNKLIKQYNKDILMNFSFLSEKEKDLYFSGIDYNFWGYNSFVLQNKNNFPSMNETVYNNTIKNKGLLLKSNTAMRNAVLNSGDTLLINKYKSWIILKRQIAKKYSQGEDSKLLENKADSLEGYLVKNSNEFSDFNKTQNICWQQVQASLKNGEVAIEFTHFPLLNPDSSFIDFTNQTQYVALILTKDSNPKMIPLFKEKQLEKIIGKFGGNNYSYINSIYGKNTEVNQELYNLIWKPIEESLKGAKKVYLSPSGLLHKISFSAIAKEQNVYLCDAYDIEVKSSTGKITESQGATQSRTLTNATLFGGITYNTDSTKQKIWNYLEGTKTETQKIDKILKEGKVEVNYFSNTSATEEEFKLMASNSNILHIATHGFFYPDPKEIKKEEEKNVEVGEITFRGGSRGFGVNSFVENKNPLMRSGLVFAGANDVWSKQAKTDSIDDGVLTAQEVAHIDMRKTELVVMSACETGLGDIKGSEGVYGLQRAFKMAGVDFMIMSLWQVPDKETEEFMTSFYKKLIKQKDIKQAFAETQKEMRTKYDPYFWAAFVLIE